MKAKEKPEALKWWSSLSINERNTFISQHPFFSKMGRDYFGGHPTSITQIYEFNNLNTMTRQEMLNKFWAFFEATQSKEDRDTNYYDLQVMNNKQLAAQYNAFFN